ncbi:MAG: class I SAM-dependent methyltransferase [Burkholderiales bacterium]|nr:class I SAM-dependent methyltransferase [Burkholderiales bacterium]
MPSLPEPSADAKAHSQQVQDHLRADIAAQGGWISFARYMELALYAPGLGYYAAGAAKFGPAGDFTTAPERSTLFGRCIARQVAQVLSETGGDLLEAGAGSGKLACDVLLELEKLGTLPERYFMLELSGELKERQHATLTAHIPYLLGKVQWLDRLPQTFTGLVLGNEVLDAMPVHLVVRKDGAWLERGVSANEAGFSWQDRPIVDSALLQAALHLEVPDDYLTEINLAAPAFITSLAERLQRGALLMIDYGFPHAEYYHPQRDQGTLMCHYRHFAHGEPFFWPGLQDITAHVDFSAIAEAGIDHGCELLGFTNQANFLINCGITDLLAETSPEDVANYLPLANQAQFLMSPAEMGELFKVIALGKGIDTSLIGFTHGDQRHRL